jgi:hypothetical protein
MEVFVLWKAETQDSLAHSALEGDLDRSLGHYFYPSCSLPTKQDVGTVDHLPAGHGVRIAYSPLPIRRFALTRYALLPR